MGLLCSRNRPGSLLQRTLAQHQPLQWSTLALQHPLCITTGTSKWVWFASLWRLRLSARRVLHAHSCGFKFGHVATGSPCAGMLTCAQSSSDFKLPRRMRFCMWLQDLETVLPGKAAAALWPGGGGGIMSAPHIRPAAALVATQASPMGGCRLNSFVFVFATTNNHFYK